MPSITLEPPHYVVDTDNPIDFAKMIHVLYQMGRFDLFDKLMEQLTESLKIAAGKIIEEEDAKERNYLEYRYEQNEWSRATNADDFKQSMSIKDEHALAAPAGPIKIHKGSRVCFEQGRSGQAFTGVVNIFHPGNNAHKLYLMPVNANNSGRMPTVPHENVTTEIYQTKTSQVITHHDPNQEDMLLKMSHIMLRRMIEDARSKKAQTKLEKWLERPGNERFVFKFNQWLGKHHQKFPDPDGKALRRFLQTHSVGFTVVKRVQGKHVFNFTSSSQNAETFVFASDSNAIIYGSAIKNPTTAWAEAIVDVVNELE